MSEFNRVVNKVQQYLAKAKFVSQDEPGNVGANGNIKIHSLFFRLDTAVSACPVYKFIQVEGPLFKFQLARQEFGVVQKVVDEPKKMFGFIQNRLPPLSGRFQRFAPLESVRKIR